MKMVRTLSRSTVVFLCFITTCIAQAPIDTDRLQKEGKQWWAHIEYLASDQLEGRLTGSEGYRKGAAYVADHFKQYGLEPAGVTGYLQPVGFDVQKVIQDKSSLSLVRDGKSQSLVLGEDALLSARLPQPKSVKAQLMFIGYGLHIPDAKYDDFAGLDLKGKILVYINGGPSDISAALKSHSRAAQEFWKSVEKSGALGVISIANPKTMDIPWSRMALSASQSGMWVSDPSLQDTKGPMFAATFNPARAETLFTGTGHTLAELLALADAGQPLPRFALGASIEAHVTTEVSHVESPNIVGVLRGSDAKLKNEYVVYTAHLDHLGIGEPIKGDKIYNGAMDNASGVASILEIARTLHESKVRPKRSILFVVVTGEEKGLLGSRYYAGKPTVLRQSMVADLNVDMFRPLFPLRILTVLGVDESTLGADVRAVVSKTGIVVQPDQEPDRNLFIRSDQYNFIRKGVPSLAFAFGYAKDSAEAKLSKDWLTERYHAPSDDLNQPVDLAAAARFNELMAQIGQKIADQDARPKWNDNSFFRRFASTK